MTFCSTCWKMEIFFPSQIARLSIGINEIVLVSLCCITNCHKWVAWIIFFLGMARVGFVLGVSHKVAMSQLFIKAGILSEDLPGVRSTCKLTWLLWIQSLRPQFLAALKVTLSSLLWGPSPLLCNLLPQMPARDTVTINKSHHLCHILLVRNKSLGLSTLKKRRLYGTLIPGGAVLGSYAKEL